MAEIIANGIRFHVQRLGAATLPADAPTVVFLHGLVMDNLSSWFFTVANAAAQRAHVLLYDLRGHGKTDRPKRGYALDDMIADLASLLDAAKIDRPVVLVGNSFGGLLALELARRLPARVAGIVLVDGHLGDDTFGEEMAATLRLQGQARDARIAADFSRWLGRHSERKRTRLAETAEALVYGTSLVDDMRRTPALGATELSTIRARVLAIYGEQSDLRARGEAAIRAIPGARIEILAGCSHSVLWEATDVVRERILGFVAESGAAR